MSGDQPLKNRDFENGAQNTYHAMVVSDVGNFMQLQTVERQPLGPNQIRIRVRACALNFADLLMIDGKYQDMPAFPLTPGMEIWGEIIETGVRIANMQPGDPVISFCGHGGLAGEIVIDSARCFPSAATMEPVTGAVLPIAYGTSHLALMRRARLQSGERLVVLGAGGGVGLTAVEIGALTGAHVIAVARGAEKLGAAAAAGAAHTINTETTPDLRAAILDTGTTHVVYDTVGGPLGDAAMRTLGPEGRYLMIGFASKDLPQLKPNHMLVKNIDAIGFNLGAYMTYRPDLFADCLKDLSDWVMAGRLKPHISQTLPLERAQDGLDLLKSRQVTGKIVITP